MNDWTEGYVAELGYTHGYYAELNPLRMRLALLQAGLVAPELVCACELGFGQGVSLNLHAAASPVDWWGTDFNPAQAGFAQALATAAGSGAHLFDDAFADFCGREDLPLFDFIGLHGIWSWVSDANRRAIMACIARRLRVGGVLYISYNTFPGWSTFAPMRRLLVTHAERLGAPGQGLVPRIEAAIAFGERVLATEPLYSRAAPTLSERMNRLKGQDRHYLAHEYFNRDWHPLYFADMAAWLAPAKLEFATSAHLLDAVDALNLSDAQQTLLAEVPDPLLRQSVRDVLVNQSFRRDYWVKGARHLSASARLAAWRAFRVVLTTTAERVPLKVAGALGEATLSERVYQPLLSLLADHRPRTLGEIEGALQGSTLTLAELSQAVMVLTGAGHVSPAQADAVMAKARKRTDALNAFLLEQAREGGPTGHLASPVTGGGIGLNRFQQLFLLARRDGAKQPEEMAAFVWRVVAAQGLRLVKGGQELTTAEENLAELQRQAREFADLAWPALRALQVA